MIALTDFITSQLASRADSEKARTMAAYLKTEEPFFGVPITDRRPFLKEAARTFVPASQAEYEEALLSLWALPHHEEKQSAVHLAQAWKKYIRSASLPLYERFIREGQWWDIVDDVAVQLVGEVWRKDRAITEPLMDLWIRDPDLWIRRSALLGQLHHREATDTGRLYAWCLLLAPEKEFFIRKAIGWVLRQYSATNPRSVRDFLVAHRAAFSGLSWREASRALVKDGLMVE